MHYSANGHSAHGGAAFSRHAFLLGTCAAIFGMAAVRDAAPVYGEDATPFGRADPNASVFGSFGAQYLAFSPNSRLLAASHSGRLVAISMFDVATAKEVLQ